MSNFTVSPGQTAELAIIKVASHVAFPPTEEEQGTLRHLVETTNKIIVDLTETTSLGTQWIRFFADMTAVAEAGTRQLLIVGANPSILSTTDLINQTPYLRLRESAEELEP